jgi:hypothetical protein
MLSTFELEGHDLARLDIACDCLDRIGQVREILAKDPVDRAASAVWRDSIKLFLSSLRQMGVDTADIPKSTLPAIHGPSRRA